MGKKKPPKVLWVCPDWSSSGVEPVRRTRIDMPCKANKTEDVWDCRDCPGPVKYVRED